ncbi:uncharacterized protein LTR77_000366 [Saxophila tyrrhenica]|uniref:Uncharacterized protein n=1 Tax=Saxophila tyrrhenica TaxID=1690608 RepID=A0AAV9PMU5_9PEZI|nr:hypothetical protein LTR77_000366 [Saxophila tyrrhenica]
MIVRQQSPLLRLPVEIQLIIYEFAVVDDTPLLLNCPCDSTYDCEEDWLEDQSLWSNGTKQQPQQPGLTRASRFLRAVTLPMFYERNVFRAHYCFNTDVDFAIKWLDRIGSENRRLLQDFCFIDDNLAFDDMYPNDLMHLRRSAVIRKMGGAIEPKHADYQLRHRVSFLNDDGDEYLELIARLFDH